MGADRLGLLLVALVALPTPTTARTEDLAPLLEPIRQEHRLPALGGAIVQGDELVALGAVGVRKRGSRQEVTPDDRWHVGSCTKAMTATLVARLVERGALSWDAAVARLLAVDGMHPEWRDARMDQLLAHRAGAPADLLPLPIWSWLWSHHGSTAEERTHLVETLLRAPPAAPPGERFLYSNAGYAIAGAMTERAAGASWEALMRREVFQPLGMESAGFGAPGRQGALDQPWGHGDEGRRPVAPGPEGDNPAALGPAGTVHLTLRDWGRFLSAHLAGARGRSGYLAPESFRKLHTPPADQDYALGWVAGEQEWGGGRVLHHWGSNTLWTAVAWLAPERDFGLVVATNQAGSRARQAVERAARELIQWLAPAH